MLCCCERDKQTAMRIMSDYNIDLGEWGVSSVPALMAKIVGTWSSKLTGNEASASARTLHIISGGVGTPTLQIKTHFPYG